MVTFQVSTATHFLNSWHHMWHHVLAVKDESEKFPHYLRIMHDTYSHFRTGNLCIKCTRYSLPKLADAAQSLSANVLSTMCPIKKKFI